MFKDCKIYLNLLMVLFQIAKYFTKRQGVMLKVHSNLVIFSVIGIYQVLCFLKQISLYLSLSLTHTHTHTHTHIHTLSHVHVCELVKEEASVCVEEFPSFTFCSLNQSSNCSFLFVTKKFSTIFSHKFAFLKFL